MNTSFITSWGFQQGISELTSIFNPVYDIATYLVPKIGSLFANTTKINRHEDESCEHEMLFEERKIVIQEIDKLAKAASISRKVIPYAALNQNFYSYGGRFSLSCPVVQIPRQHLFRNGDFGVFGAEKKHNELVNAKWRFTDDETRFMILRSMGEIATNESLLKLTARVIMVVALLLIHFFPGTWIVTLPVFVVAMATHYFVNRSLNARWDSIAVEQLEKIIDDSEEAKSIASNALKKIHYQELHYRKQSRLGKLLIKADGNRRFDFVTPPITKRIEELATAKKIERKASFRKARSYSQCSGFQSLVPSQRSNSFAPIFFNCIYL